MYEDIEKIKSEYSKLRPKQKAWISAYLQCGSGVEACKAAGYKGNNHNVLGAQNLSKLSKFFILFDADDDSQIDKTIADMNEVKRLWTKIMRNSEENTKDRLKASELFAKTSGAFTVNLDIGNKDDNAFLIKDLSLEDKLKIIEGIKNE